MSQSMYSLWVLRHLLLKKKKKKGLTILVHTLIPALGRQGQTDLRV
ncbi:rCG60065 [Rattus norvegicus]|uniref:RCG60065 n=1 Tax=Rattus norvegicus TaxID=10116 RepID=A6HT32_RAT|nr:rCG60065 [Rattus norvegicus]